MLQGSRDKDMNILGGKLVFSLPPLEYLESAPAIKKKKKEVSMKLHRKDMIKALNMMSGW